MRTCLDVALVGVMVSLVLLGIGIEQAVVVVHVDRVEERPQHAVAELYQPTTALSSAHAPGLPLVVL